MTPSDEVRKLLDERGIEHFDYGHENHVWWCGADNVGWHAESRPSVNGSYVKIEAVLTPAQAIAATVGEEHEMHICRRCGVAYELNIIDKGFGKSRFCPNCGHKELY